MSITFTVSNYPARSFGGLLKKLRLESGLSQKESAQKIEANEMSVVAWERNLRKPRARNLVKIARSFQDPRRFIQ